jgi:transcriptional regulator with XRE-family HTH domain
MDEAVQPASTTGHFGELLRRLRVETGLTQEELAEKSGMSVRALSNLECGTSAPRIKSTRLLAAALDVDEEMRILMYRLARMRRGPQAGAARAGRAAEEPVV